MFDSIRNLISSHGQRSIQSLCRGYLSLSDPTERRATELIPPQWLEELLESTVSINYGSERPMKEGLKLLDKKSLANVESLLVFRGRGGLAYAASYLHRIASSAFEITWIAADPDGAFMAGEPLQVLSAHGELHYGYCRRLGLEMAPISETKMRKSLLGTTSVRAISVKDTWLSGHDDIKAGSVRGLYPVNYWSAEALVQMEILGINWPASVQIGVGLNRLNFDEQAHIESKNPAIRRFIRFGLI